MATFVKSGTVIINLDRVTYVDLQPYGIEEPDEKDQMLYVFFDVPAGGQSAHYLRLSGREAMGFLQAIDRLGGSSMAADWQNNLLG